MFVLYCVSYIIFTAYVSYILRQYKSPKSLSETYYLLQRNQKGWVFQLALITASLLILPVWLQASSINTQFLAFLSCGGLVFVGVAPAFKLKLDGNVHVVSAVLSGISAVTWMICSGMFGVVITGVIIAFGLSIRHSNLLFWLEVIAFLCIYYSIAVI